MVFLGILLDGEHHILIIPEKKRIRAINKLQSVLSKKKATIKELQQLTGLLNFLNKAIVLGRAFTRRMYSKFSHLELKPHHHIRLDKEFKEDCQVWCSFLLSTDRGLNQPFVDISDRVSAETLNLFTDAGKGESLGIGGIFGHRWFFAQWEPGFITDCNPSIEYLE